MFCNSYFCSEEVSQLKAVKTSLAFRWNIQSKFCNYGLLFKLLGMLLCSVIYFMFIVYLINYLQPFHEIHVLKTGFIYFL
jgi:hypothetical protein